MLIPNHATSSVSACYHEEWVHVTGKNKNLMEIVFEF